MNTGPYALKSIHDKCPCGHARYDHYSEKYDYGCIHRMGRYAGKKCICPGFSEDNLIYLEKLCVNRDA
jgi:hypothetical protein